MKLIGFEEHFSEKVQEIDDKYQQQIAELKQDNIGLRFEPTTPFPHFRTPLPTDALNIFLK